MNSHPVVSFHSDSRSYINIDICYRRIPGDQYSGMVAFSASGHLIFPSGSVNPFFSDRDIQSLHKSIGLPDSSFTRSRRTRCPHRSHLPVTTFFAIVIILPAGICFYPLYRRVPLLFSPFSGVSELCSMNHRFVGCPIPHDQRILHQK